MSSWRYISYPSDAYYGMMWYFPSGATPTRRRPGRRVLGVQLAPLHSTPARWDTRYSATPSSGITTRVPGRGASAAWHNTTTAHARRTGGPVPIWVPSPTGASSRRATWSATSGSRRSFTSTTPTTRPGRFNRGIASRDRPPGTRRSTRAASRRSTGDPTRARTSHGHPITSNGVTTTDHLGLYRTDDTNVPNYHVLDRQLPAAADVQRRCQHHAVTLKP